MDVQRVEEIIDSPDKITVTFQGEPVWIQSVDEITQIAEVHPEHNPQDKQMIPVSELREEKE